MHNKLIQRSLKQVAVYWPPAVEDRHGQKTYPDPVEVPCRWDDVNEQYLDPRTGNVAMSKARVYVGQTREDAPREVKELGVVWLSNAAVTDDEGLALAQLSDPADPFANPGAFEVRRVDRFPNARGDNFLRTCYL